MLQLRQAFAVRSVGPDAASIDPALDVLVVDHPQHLAHPTLVAVDQYVMHGGKLLLMVDPHSEAQAAGEAEDTASDVPELLHAWGVRFDPGMVVGDLEGAWRVRGGADERVQAVDYPPWFTLRDGVSHDDPATAELSEVTVASAGALAPLPGMTATFEPLLRSSQQSGLIPAAAVRGQPDPVAILAAFKPDGERRVLAARLRGRLASAFPDGAPGHLAGTEAANVVVVADSDILDDRFWVQVQDFLGEPQAHPFADNGAFLVNLVGTLAGGDALLGMRGRGTSLRPLTAVDDLRRAAELRYRRSEQDLRRHLDETAKRLADLRGGTAGAGPRAVLGAEQERLIDGLTDDIARTRARLRSVQLDLRHDVDALQSRWALFCTLFSPALVAVAATAHGLRRRCA